MEVADVAAIERKTAFVTADPVVEMVPDALFIKLKVLETYLYNPKLTVSVLLTAADIAKRRLIVLQKILSVGVNG